MKKNIKSVDFKAVASGHGVVNWNGGTDLTPQGGGKTVSNHKLPKLRNFTPFTGKTNEEGTYKFRKSVEDIGRDGEQLYVSSNCIRHHVWKDEEYSISEVDTKNADSLLKSSTGLVRGYVHATGGFGRKSALLLEDFVDSLGNLNFEQFSTSGERDSNSIHSATTAGDTAYTSFGSLSIEDIQFICLDNTYGNQALIADKVDGDKLAKEVAEYIQTMDTTGELKAGAEFGHYARNVENILFHHKQFGILLNDDAIQIIVNDIIRRFKELYIVQGRGHMLMESVDVDYNNSNKAMRIKRDASSVDEEKGTFHKYFVKA